MRDEELTPEVAADLAERGDKLRDEYEDAACEAEALRCLECGFKRGGHSPDCESGCHHPGMILVPSTLLPPSLLPSSLSDTNR